MPGLRFKLQLSVVAIGHDAIADDQPESGPLPDALGRKKRFKEVFSHVLRNARPVVVDLHQNVVIVASRANSDLSLAVDRVDRIVDEIRPHLVELVAVGRNVRERPIIIPDQRDPFEFMGQHDRKKRSRRGDS